MTPGSPFSIQKESFHPAFSYNPSILNFDLIETSQRTMCADQISCWKSQWCGIPHASCAYYKGPGFDPIAVFQLNVT